MHACLPPLAPHLRHQAVHVGAVRSIGGTEVPHAGYGGAQLGEGGIHDIHRQVQPQVAHKVVLLLALAPQRGAQRAGQPWQAVVLRLAVLQRLRYGDATQQAGS